ncbi:hypothetical protein V1639_04585 [Pseudarthrobacter sp. J75]|uniref:hypothetical protein n=1 Tax=Pseudarthrobacter sp. J75 TaxID=3116486 RepID=UPI002E80821B|nr:hypothetical protein [Pseudarthrobacter sp. J75]MEE2528308.1 hypothetical protein [Pseudarthrobacter sp. J75]
MGRKDRVGDLEQKIKAPQRREPFDWEATYGAIGALTHQCALLFVLTSKTGELPEPHNHQLMRVSLFAMNMLTENRPVQRGEREGLRQLMTDPEYRGFGWSEVKHPKALKLYRMCAARGWLSSPDTGH